MPAPLQVFALPLGLLQANCFVVIQGESGLVIDPGDEAPVVVDAMRHYRVRPAGILVTHGHYDHVGAVAALSEQYGVSVYVGAEDVDEVGAGDASETARYRIDPALDVVALSGEQRLPLPIDVAAIPTPGHSPGSYTFAADSHLFCGDLLFRGSIGRTDLPGGNLGQLLDSVATLVRRFPPETIVHCGHGPDTSLGRELALNPFLTPLRHDPAAR